MAKRMWVVEIKMGGGWMAQDRLCVSRKAAEEEKARFPHPHPYHARVREWKRVKEKASETPHPTCAAVVADKKICGDFAQYLTQHKNLRYWLCSEHHAKNNPNEAWDMSKGARGYEETVAPQANAIAAPRCCARTYHIGATPGHGECVNTPQEWRHRGDMMFHLCLSHAAYWDSH